MGEKGGAAAAVAAITAKAKLAGLWRDKVAVTDPSGEKPAHDGIGVGTGAVSGMNGRGQVHRATTRTCRQHGCRSPGF
jgi:hypothetical protein